MKNLCSESELQKKYLSAVNRLESFVTATLGPKGQTVLLKRKDNKPFITKDGVTVSSFFSLEDPVENAAAVILKQAAEETATSAGDGTTTAILFAAEIYKESLKFLNMDVPPVILKEQIEKAVEICVQEIQNRSEPLTTFQEVNDIAILSTNNDKKLGDLISQTIDNIGKNGTIVVEESKSSDTLVEYTEGFAIDSGLISKAFINDERRGLLVFDSKTLVFVTDESLTTVDELMPVLQLASRENKPLLIVANDVSGQALAALIMNRIRGTMRVAAIKPPRYGEERNNILEDLAIATGGTLISKFNGLTLNDVKLEHLGTCQTVEASLRSCTFIGCEGDEEVVKQRVESIKAEIPLIDNLMEAQKQQERITRLNSMAAIIKVGGYTESEVIEKKHRIEDALAAVKSAQDMGIVVGGGITYLLISKALGKDYGSLILKEALKAPIIKLATNSGISGEVVREKVTSSSKPGFGFNFKSMKYENLRKVGIIEPAKVQIEALKNGSSAAISLIFSNHAIIES
jgi:chaperonin GroEL